MAAAKTVKAMPGSGIRRFKMNIRLDFMAPMLGTKPSDPEVFKRFIASKAPSEETQENDIRLIKEIDNLVFIRESTIPIEGSPVSILEHPLRAQTPQGERVSLAASEMIEDAVIEFTVLLYEEKDALLVREWLDYGFDNGIGQWHNSGKGTFRWTETDDSGKVICANIDKDPWADARCCAPDPRHAVNE